MRDFNNKTSLVTGAASGIGRCIALELAREGSDLALVDINEEGLNDVKQEVERLGRSASVHLVDVTDMDQVNTLATEVRPHVLANVAGIAVIACAEETPRKDWERVLAVNLWGPIDMFRVFLPSLKEQGGHIINVASADGVFAIPGSAAYSTSKFALVGFSEVLGIELAGYGIGVTAVCPGLTMTPMVDTISIDGYSREKIDRLINLVKPVAFTTPEKLASATMKAVKRNKPVLVHTPLARAIYYIKRLSPRLYRDLVGRWAFRMVKDLGE